MTASLRGHLKKVQIDPKVHRDSCLLQDEPELALVSRLTQALPQGLFLTSKPKQPCLRRSNHQRGFTQAHHFAFHRHFRDVFF